MRKLSRRHFFKLTGGSIAALGLGGWTPGGTAAEGTAVVTRVVRRAPLPAPKGQRVVVVGGGWSGLTAAKYIKKEDPSLDVVLVERREIFVSSPISNLWYDGLVDFEFLTHSFLDAARHNDYWFFSAMVIDVDRDKRRVYTSDGYIDYDFLLLAPGIDYDYPRIGVEDPADQFRLKTQYPGGFIPGSEDITLMHKLEAFASGDFLLTVPTGNYRCLPAPYERTCLVADYFKRNRIGAKVVLLDGNPDITIKKAGFHQAFEELYKDYVEYVPSFEITGVDVDRKRVRSEFGERSFDDAALYPRVRASRLIERLGLVDPDSTQKEARIDPFKYNVVGDERVYVAGDSRPMPYSKSGNTANSEAHHVAKVIAARANGKEVDWRSPHTVCYSVVASEPMRAIMVDTYYAYDEEKKAFGFAKTRMDQEADRAKGLATLEWARGLYRDMFS
ncbi:MAG: NAD(P)/FAD-dependent oxidoreductase [Gammaproteobacteria bacterium]|nr:NAD(P)/FAD-dependent oxidoreductase [Gammaproteobacteria bacterium]